MESAQHLLVDGYNVVHAWPELRRALASDGRDVARARLVENVRVLHDSAQLRVSVVFDGRGADIAVERPGGHTTFSIIYSPAGMTADDVIEQLVANARPPANVIVVTADAAERETVEALGAEVRSPDQLRQWIDEVQRRQSSAVQSHSRKVEADWRAAHPRPSRRSKKSAP